MKTVEEIKYKHYQRLWYNNFEVVSLKKYNLIIVIEKDEDGVYIASVPALKGCYTQAKTVEELIPRIREAVELCLEVEQNVYFQNEFVGVQQLEIII